MTNVRAGRPAAADIREPRRAAQHGAARRVSIQTAAGGGGRDSLVRTLSGNRRTDGRTRCRRGIIAIAIGAQRLISSVVL